MNKFATPKRRPWGTPAVITINKKKQGNEEGGNERGKRDEEEIALGAP